MQGVGIDKRKPPTGAGIMRAERKDHKGGTSVLVVEGSVRALGLGRCADYHPRVQSLEMGRAVVT